MFLVLMLRNLRHIVLVYIVSYNFLKMDQIIIRTIHIHLDSAFEIIRTQNQRSYAHVEKEKGKGKENARATI